MNVLFVHRNMPGQFGHLAADLARRGNRVVFLTKADRSPPAGVTRALYPPPRAVGESGHHYLRSFEDAVLHGQAVAKAGLGLQQRGFAPELVVAHPGWGEAMYVKDVFPDARLLSYCEFFYRSSGADVGFDPEQTVDIDLAARVRTRTAPLLIALAACDQGVSPTRWQRSVHPPEWQSKIEVVFDGVDAARVHPDPGAVFRLPDGRAFRAEDQVITYVARNLEPYRGFPSFMRALPAILERLPQARVVIVGGDKVSYGRAPGDGRTWRAVMTEEAAPDPERVHFVPRLPYADYVRLLQVSSAHVYLTVPFVLSWSAVEALAAGCLVVGSRTPPVEEVLRDGDNGFLVDFFAPAEIADRVVEAVRQRDRLAPMRRRARESVLGQYDLATCLPRQIQLLQQLTGGRLALGD